MDKGYFTRVGTFNQHYAHVWTLENPHGTWQHAAQWRSSLIVWAGILGDHLIGPYLLSSHLGGRANQILLRKALPELLDASAVPLSVAPLHVVLA